MKKKNKKEEKCYICQYDENDFSNNFIYNHDRGNSFLSIISGALFLKGKTPMTQADILFIQIEYCPICGRKLSIKK